MRRATVSVCTGLLALVLAPAASALTFAPTPASPILLTARAPGGQSDAGLVTGDFNGDGKPDLAASWDGPGPDGVGSYVSVLLGNGSGGFTPAPGSPFLITLGASATAGALAVGHFDAGHKLDLAVVSSAGSGNVPGTISILLGSGDGSFTSAGAPIAVGNDPTSVAAGDFTGDGTDDLAVTNEGSGTVSILLGNGDGTFTPAKSSPLGDAGDCPQAATTGFFNGDGKLDLAVADDGCGDDGGGYGYGYGYGNGYGDEGDVYILLGNGSGGFTPTAASPLGVTGSFTSIVSGDVNGDGNADLALAPGPGESVPVLLGDGKGDFSPAAGATARGYSPAGVALGDFSGGGKLDLAAAGATSDPHYPTDGVVQVMVGNGGGTFVPVPDSPFTVGAEPNATPSQVVAADFNKDGRDDIAVLSDGCQCTGPNVTGAWGPSVTVLLNRPGDSSVPTAALSASPNPALTGDAVTLNASSSYGGSVNDPAVDYRWDLGSGSFAVDTGANAMDTAEFSKPGLFNVRVKVTNETGASDMATLEIDVRPAPPPGQVGLSIDQGDYATNSPSVDLDLIWPPFATQAEISNDSAFDTSGGTQTLAVAPTISWTLPPAGAANHHETIYLRFPNSSNNQIIKHGIVLDTTAPTVKGARFVQKRRASDAGAGRVKRRAFRVHIHATERVSGISVVQFSTGTGQRSKRATIALRSRMRRGTLNLIRVITFHLRGKPGFVRVQSAAGTWSDWHRIA